MTPSHSQSKYILSIISIPSKEPKDLPQIIKSEICSVRGCVTIWPSILTIPNSDCLENLELFWNFEYQLASYHFRFKYPIFLLENHVFQSVKCKFLPSLSAFKTLCGLHKVSILPLLFRQSSREPNFLISIGTNQ